MREELQAAILALLTGNLPDSLGPVLGAVPQDQAYPYVTVATSSSTPADTDSSVGALVKVEVRLHAKAGQIALSTMFVDSVRNVLHHTDSLSLLNATVVTVYMDGDSVEEPSDEGKARETAVTVAVLLDDVSNPTVTA